MIKNITPKDAHQFLQDNPQAVLLDVRSSMEFEYIGHPIGAVHVPLMEPPTWQGDPDFIEKVNATIETARGTNPVSVPVLALCRSGKRSETAGSLLLAAGYTEVYNILEGFEGDRDEQKHRNTSGGWRFHNLPWEQN